jgi:lipopolysaccharide transport system permease protein
VTTAILFLSPVFYAPESLPERYRWLLYANPMTLAVTHARDVIFWGCVPEVTEWAIALAFSLLVAIAGACWFMRTEKAFADVI